MDEGNLDLKGNIISSETFDLKRGVLYNTWGTVGPY